MVREDKQEILNEIEIMAAQKEKTRKCNEEITEEQIKVQQKEVASVPMQTAKMKENRSQVPN